MEEMVGPYCSSAGMIDNHVLISVVLLSHVMFDISGKRNANIP